jgi:hypothetical protein
MRWEGVKQVIEMVIECDCGVVFHADLNGPEWLECPHCLQEEERSRLARHLEGLH